MLLGNGDGTFKKARKFRTGGGSWAVQVVDVNNDGIPDLIVANFCGGAHCKDGGSLAILLGVGKGKFAKAQTYPVHEIGTYSLALGDFNRDGNLDVVVSSFCNDEHCSSGGAVGVFLGNGDGTFQPVVNYPTAGRPFSVAAADLNGDGILDLAVANGFPDVAVLLGNGDGTFQMPVSYGVSDNAYGLAVADVDQDGKPDLLVTTGGYTRVDVISVLRGNGDGSFQTPSTYSTLEYGSSTVAIADVNGDHLPDLVVGSECTSGQCVSGDDGALSVLLHDVNP